MSSRHFQFKEHDAEGLETLQAIKEANRFNKWMYDQIAPFISSPVLEVGSGIGNISFYCMKEGHQLMMTDIRQEYLDFLNERFFEQTTPIRHLDLVEESFEETNKDLLGSFQTVFALNVIEHIENEQLAIRNAAKLLASGGRLIILVPAHPLLYNKLDKNLFHYKRYHSRDLKRLMNNELMELQSLKWFNGLGIAAWLYGGMVSRKGVIGGGDMKLYNKLVPLAKWMDRLTFFRIGLSIIGVSRKK
ncbi:MAG: class I SAM-dependent methyltransferase [Bacteroidota bacterium]